MSLNQHASPRQALRDDHGAAPVGDAAAERAVARDPQRSARFRAPRAYRDHASERVGPVRDGARAAGDVDPLERGGIGKRRARTDTALRGHPGAVDHHQGASAGEAADRRDGGVPFRDDVDARHRFERLHQILRRAPRDLCRRQQRRRRPR